MVQELCLKAYTTKNEFSILPCRRKTAIGKGMRNAWAATESTAPLNISFQANGGFNTLAIWKKIRWHIWCYL